MSVLGFGHPTRKDNCLSCGHPFDTASIVGRPDGKPREGDATVCIKCAHCMVFGKRLKLRNPTIAEAIKLCVDPRIALVQRAIRYVNGAGKLTN